VKFYIIANGWRLCTVFEGRCRESLLSKTGSHEKAGNKKSPQFRGALALKKLFIALDVGSKLWINLLLRAKRKH